MLFSSYVWIGVFVGRKSAKKCVFLGSFHMEFAPRNLLRPLLLKKSFYSKKSDGKRGGFHKLLAMQNTFAL